MRVAIIGSRSRNTAFDRRLVQAVVDDLPPGTVVISGGAPGPDTFAKNAAKARGLEFIEHLPDLSGLGPHPAKFRVAQRYYDRNRRIAEECDRMVALVSFDRNGGTENALGYAMAMGKPFTIITTDGKMLAYGEHPSAPKALL